MKTFKKTFATLTIACMMGAMLTGCSSKTDEIDSSRLEFLLNEAERENEESKEPATDAPETQAQLPETQTSKAAPQLPEAATSETQMPETQTTNPDAEAIAPEDVVPGENMSTAGMMPLRAQISGTIPVDSVWYSFTTEANPDAVYKIMAENTSAKDDPSELSISIVDEFGTGVGRLNYIVNDGSIYTYTFEDAEPNTTYYLHMIREYGDECDYNVIIKVKE